MSLVSNTRNPVSFTSKNTRHHSQTLEPTIKTTPHSKYLYSQLNLNPNVDIKSTGIDQHTLAFQSIEKEIRRGNSYYDMKISFVDTKSNNIQTLTCTTNGGLRTDIGLLSKPTVFENGNYGIAWRKQAGYTINIFEQKNGAWQLKCSKSFEEVLPETSHPRLLGNINNTFSLLTGKDDYNYQSVLLRNFDSSCTQLTQAKELSTPRVYLREIHAENIDEKTSIVSVHHLDGSSESIVFNRQTTEILSRRMDSDYPMSEPIQMTPGILSSLKNLEPSVNVISLDASSSSLKRNSKTTSLLSANTLEHAFGILPGPNNTFLALQYTRQTLLGSLIDTTGTLYGLPFQLNNIPERPKLSSDAFTLLPVDVIKQGNQTFFTMYHPDKVELLSLELTFGQMNPPTGMPTMQSAQPTSPHIRTKEGHDSSASLIIILATILGVIGGVGALYILFKYCSKNTPTQTNTESYQPAPSAPPLELEQPVMVTAVPLDKNNQEIVDAGYAKAVL